MKSVKTVFLAVAACALIAAPAWAQSEDAPEILTSDLLSKQRVDSEQLTVHFVFVDDDSITQVFIDGEPQQIDPGDMVTVVKEFRFKPGRQLIKVVAVDEAGNRREKSYLVLLGVEFDAGDERDEPKLAWQASVKVSMEIDDNPTNDLSSPIPIAGLKLEGAVPDEDQPDTRTSLQGVFALSYGDISGYFGAQSATYAKSENEPLGAFVVFLGGNYKLKFSESSHALLGGSFTDVNVGGNDYTQITTLLPAFVLTDKDEEDNTKHTFGLDFAMKTFAESSREDASQFTLKWNYSSKDLANQDSYLQSFKYGNSTEGTDASEYDFYSMDFDYVLLWDSGFRNTNGFGFQYRQYPNDPPLTEDTPLGSLRVDILVRYSIGLGYNFLKTWNAMFNYEYLADLSNKSPYVRQIYGVTVSGAF